MKPPLSPCFLKRLPNLRLFTTDTSKLGSSIRLSKVLSQHAENVVMSRREAERVIRSGDVALDGNTITSPMFLVDEKILRRDSVLRLRGKPLQIKSKARLQEDSRVWVVHKMPGEIVTEHDPNGRPSLMERLARGGVGKSPNGNRAHLKPVGRLDMPSEGLILVTTDGNYAREMELPANKVHRTYRVRTHGLLTEHKLARIQKGVACDGIRYPGMKVEVEAPKRRKMALSANRWLKVTCAEGKNRQIRRVFDHLGLKVNRLIRVSYGDYSLDTVPPGMAIEVPMKPLSAQRRQGRLIKPERKQKRKPEQNNEASPVQWVRPQGN